jgi:hypothetical protein
MLQKSVMVKAWRLGGFAVGVCSMACGGTAESGFDGGKVKDGGGAGGDATMMSKDTSVPILVMDTGSSEGAPPCTGIACNVQSCGGGVETTVSGYVYAPNGTLPLYDVQVFIPNTALAPLAKGVQCENCGTPLSGSPIATALSDPTGHFVLTGVPTGADVPIVVQLGKWRRQTSIPKVNGCVDNALTDPNMTRLPKNQMEGNMPHIALTTGGCDQMGCMLPKVGIDPMEFGSQADGYNKAVNVYNASGGSAGLGATSATNIWSDATVLNTYDEAIFSCECTEPPEAPAGSGDYSVVTDYLNMGGRIFTTDFQYTWYKYSPDPNMGQVAAGSPITGLGSIFGGAPPAGSPMTLSTTVPKAVALAAWLKYVFSGVPLPSGITFPLDSYSQMGQINPDIMWGNVQWLDGMKTVQYANSPYESGWGGGPPPADAGGLEPRIFTVDTPVGDPLDKQCGRGIHIDGHVDQDGMNTVGPGYPVSGCSTTLKADEAAFAFFFFDLSSCISNNKVPPSPPPPVK